MAALQARELLNLLGSWRDAYLAWPVRLAALRESIESGHVTSGLDVVPRDRLLRSLQSWIRDTEPTGRPKDLERVMQEVTTLVKEARRDLARDRAGSLSAHLHQKLQGIIGLLTSHRSAQTRLRSCCETLRAFRHAKEASWVPDVVEAFEVVTSAFESDSLRGCERAIERTIPLGSTIPVDQLSESQTRRSDASQDWAIVAVDDDPLWRKNIEGVLSTLTDRLGKRNLEYWIVGDRSSAQKRLAVLLRRQKGQVRHLSLLLIADIGLPGTADDLTPPVRAEGLALLKWVRDKSLGLPIVVLTTGANAFDESLAVRALGISDYFLKGTDSLERLRTQLDRIITASHPFSLHLIDGRTVLCIDGVEIELAPHLLKLTRALFDNGLQATAVELANAMTDVDGSHPSAITIDKYIWKLRGTVAKAFQGVGRSIDPARELLVTRSVNDRFVYELIGHPEEEPPGLFVEDQTEFRILVLEDDKDLWQSPIVGLLKERGYQAVGASSVDEALHIAKEFRPHAACLDLQVPIRQGVPPESSAGLTCLSELRTFLPSLRVIVLTSLIDEDVLREDLIRQGVEVDDMVRKQPEWQGELVCRAHRLQRQWKRGVVLPLRSTQHVLELKFFFDANGDLDQPQSVEAFGKKWGLRDLRRRYLWSLAKRDATRVPANQIAREVYPNDDLAKALAKLKQLRGDMRDEIARCSRVWFRTDQDEAREIAEFILASDRGLGDLLNARTETNRPPLSTRSVKQLKLSQAVIRRLLGADIRTVGDLTKYSDARLEEVVDGDAIDEIDEQLAALGLARSEDE